MKTRVLAGACAVTLLGAGVASADPGPQAPELKPATAAGSSPTMSPGQHRVSLPADRTERYLQLSRHTSDNVVVTAYATPAAGATEDAVNLSLVLPDGETECARDTASLSTSSDGSPLEASVALDAGKSPRAESTDPDCAEADDLLLRVSRGSGVGDEKDDNGGKALPVELTFTKEPSADSGRDKPVTAEDVQPRDVPLKDDEQVEPGDSPHTAAPLGADSGTTVQVTPGTTAFYRVRVGWNQQLDAAAQLPANGSSYRTDTDLRLRLSIRGPHGLATAADGNETGSISSDADVDPVRLTAGTAPVRWANRQVETLSDSSADADAVRWTTQPGWYVVAVTVGPSYGETLPKDAAPVPGVLTVRVSGQEQQGPTFTAGGEQVAAPGTGRLSGPGDSSMGFLGMAMRIGVTVLALAAAGAALLWWRRGSRA